MDEKVASYLLASLHQRVSLGQIGTVSDQEKDALAFAIQLLGAGQTPYTSVVVSAAPTTDNIAARQVGTATNVVSLNIPPPLPTVALVADSLNVGVPSMPDLLLCLDFGTAMSKAFASAKDGSKYDLELGRAAGSTGYTLPSSVFVGDDARMYFGFEAIEQSQDFNTSGRERLDSIKSWLSFREDTNIDGKILGKNFNPTLLDLTEGDLIRIFLAYLTDIAGMSLTSRNIPGTAGVNLRLVKRRFARPCGKNSNQASWVDTLMKRLLAEAQLLADTFSGRWAGGIPVMEIKAALNSVKELGQRPDYLIDVGIAEPVAVAAGAVAKSENRRDAFMVVDAGAGTTDFGLFFVMRNAELENPTVFQISESIKGLNQAGDKVDQLLQAFIRSKENFDPNTASGRLVEADLRRRIRVLKELLFTSGRVDYVLEDSSVGTVLRADFDVAPNVEQFGNRLEAGFREALEGVDESYLDYLATTGVTLQVILTGGSARLPMIQALGRGHISVKGRDIKREFVDAAPEWMEDESKEMVSFYPQLAVAIGGASNELPRTDFAPDVLLRVAAPTYVATNLALSGT